MGSLKQLCQPRKSVFDKTKRDTVLDLSDLVQGKIDGTEFFTENFVTEGMRTLLTEAFRRLEGKSAQGLFKLTQAMGGGKTHNLIALGLLAKDSKLRTRVLSGIYDPKDLGQVRVVAFSGRESDAPFGIWGEVAAQLGKKEAFKEYYSPLQAPGQTAWINLLKGQPTLILLDELPPYLDSALSKTVGDSNLARVTGTALANLFVALGKADLANVCVVVSDLTSSYAQGKQALSQAMGDLQDEINRLSMDLQPVRINTDEFYHILRTRLFEKLPTAQQIGDVAQAYGKAVRDAKQMDITNQSPEQFAQRVQESYPFHPAIKDLYARFRENRGFQQTRALIRLMRVVVSQLWAKGEADNKQLIAAHDLDFNDQETLSEVKQINSSLENAIAHDIANEGNAVAEVMDTNLSSSDTRDACRLVLMSSLANVPNAVVGLSVPEVIANLCEPGRKIASLKADVLEKLSTAAWYLHANRDGKLYFKDVQNLNAKLDSLSKAYVREQSIKELRQRLDSMFAPSSRWCYQAVQSLPGVDEIELSQDRVTLVVTEPYAGSGLNPHLKQFWEQATWKNRVAFLTGTRNTFENLLDNAKRLKAIDHILADMHADKVPENDPQMKQANDLKDTIHLQFLSACKETFTILYYPTKNSLAQADFLMAYKDNKYEGESQIIDLLKSKQKFTEDISGDIFRKKCEQRLFTANPMLWSQIKERAGQNAEWQWHRPDALDSLKDECIHRDVWREQGSYVEKGPFPQPATQLQIQERSRDEDTGEVELKLVPVHGDTVYAEIGGPATTASQKVDGGIYRTAEMEVSFLAVDSSKKHEPGPPVTWRNRVTMKYRLFSGGNRKKMCELRAAPPGSNIRYTTDGSDPKIAGGAYDSPFEVPKGTQVVLAYAEQDGVESDSLKIAIDWEKDEEVRVDPTKPVTWKRKHSPGLTNETYAFLQRIQDFKAQASGVRISITGQHWMELTMHEGMWLSGVQLLEVLEAVRKLLPDGQVGLESTALHFERGQDLLDWVNDAKTQLLPGEIVQK